MKKHFLRWNLLTLMLTAVMIASCGAQSQAEEFAGAGASAGEQTPLNPNAGQSQTPASPQETAMVNAALAEANAIRRQNNLPELQVDRNIASAARAHALDMAQRNYFEHATPEGKSPFDRMHDHGAQFRAAAENIARGQRTAAQVFQSWMNSPGHRRNLLNGKYRRHGLSWINGYWVHDLAD